MNGPALTAGPVLTVGDVARFLEAFSPRSLAAEWDNVGLLVGDSAASAARIMTCLTITPASAAEAVDEQVDLIVAHHPLPFRPLRQLTMASHEGRLLWDLARAGVAVYSPHTAYDSCVGGINEQLAASLELNDVQPLEPLPSGGVGRYGRLAEALPLSTLASRVKSALGVEHLQCVGGDGHVCRQVAVACGSAGDLLGAAIARGCDIFLTGEARFHTCLEAEAAGLALLLPGHYATERPGVERLAERLQAAFAASRVWASRRERDPLGWD